MTSHEYARNLLTIADYLYNKPKMEIGDTNGSLSIYISDERLSKDCLRKIGEFKKDYSDNYFFKAIVKIGSAMLTFSMPRYSVCKKVKKLQEVDDWECESVLKDIVPEESSESTSE